MTSPHQKVRQLRRSALTLEACEARVLMATGPSLGVAASFAILGGTTVTNTGATNITGNVGVSSGSSITGFPPGIVTGGALHADDATAIQAGADLAAAYGVLAGETPDTFLSGQNLGGLTLTPGVYNFSTSAQLSGILTLDAQGNPNAVFVIQTGTTLITASNASVVLINSAHANNVYWQVGTSATIGPSTSFQGNILASTAITMNTGASISPGRALAENGAVTMDTNTDSNVFTTPLTITAINQNNVYGSNLPPLTVTYSGFINGDTSANLTTQPSVGTTATNSSHVGNYPINASGAVDPDYTITYVTGNLAITPAPLIITAVNQTSVYGSSLPTLTASYATFVNGDTSTNLTTQPSLSTTATGTSHVGTYTITASGAVDPDYTITYVTGNLAITQAPLIITANNQTSVYGSSLPTLTASYATFVNGDTSTNLTTQPSLSTTATGTSHVGTYTITASGAVDPDYTITYATGNLAITQAPLVITADNQTKVYGAALPTLTASYATFVNGDTSTNLTTQPSLSTTATGTSHVGTYTITASGAVDPDYTITYATGNLAITQAPLVITADNQTKVYGAALPTLTASYATFVNGDTSANLTTQPTLNTTATNTSHVGSYTITASGAVDPDYSISYATGNLAITQAPLVITADNQTKVYGAALPTLTASYATFVNGDTSANLTTQPSLATIANSTSHVGSYTITASGAVDPDYAISYATGQLAVTSAPLVITVNNQTKVYGAALPPLTDSYTGFVNGDTSASLTTQPTLGTTATSTSHVASYPITASGAVDPDYTIGYASGNLTVTPALLTITANNQTKAYGSALPVLTASYSGLVNGDTAASLTTPPTLTTTATASSHVANNPYPITASGASDSDYTITNIAGSLNVTPVALTITANSLSKGFGAPVPPLTLTETGFVNGDSSATLGQAPNTAPTVTTTATASSPVAGSPYPITVSGAADPDYTIQSVNGALTVIPRSVVSGQVYLDLNANGLADVGEPGLAGRVVFLDLKNDGTLDAGDPTATTDVNGNFTINNTSSTTGPVVEATAQDSTNRYVVDQTSTSASGFVSIGVVPISPIAPVPVVPNPFTKTPSSDANTAYVQSLYHAVLGRTGADSEVATWLVKLNSGLSQQQVALGFVNSLEHRQNEVTSYYKNFLHRAPDPRSVDWVNDLLNGVSEETVVEGFLNSPEYQAAHQDSTLFIDDLYLDVLGRQGESTGIAGYQADLASNASRSSIVARFVESFEADNQLVASFYTAYLNRPREQGPTSDFWVNLLESPNGSATDVAVGILVSPEYLKATTTPKS